MKLMFRNPRRKTHPEYRAELDAVNRHCLQILPQNSRRVVDYWTNNPVFRWNEIALELIAKYNLIPGPNADGSYTLPESVEP